MADHIKMQHSPRDVRAAGKVLAGQLSYTEEVVHYFRVAHNFRMAHAYPLIQERARLSRGAGEGADTSGRIKRMASIRSKLARSGLNLDKMQDLAGIRAILPDMECVRRLVDFYQQRHGDTIKPPVDYIASPKETGYRSVHIVKTHQGPRDEFNGMKVEIQIRTRLQHVWAAAQETVGIVTKNNLKGGEGDPRWQRLMGLVSAHMAMVEGQSIGDHFPHDEQARRRELREIAAELGAVQILSGFKALSASRRQTSSRTGFFMLSLDADQEKISVHHIAKIDAGAEEYFRAVEGGERLQSLIVAVDSADALLRTYPSYFLDIGEFLGVLNDALGQSSKSGPDFSFLADRSWRPKRGG